MHDTVRRVLEHPTLAGENIVLKAPAFFATCAKSSERRREFCNDKNIDTRGRLCGAGSWPRDAAVDIPFFFNSVAFSKLSPSPSS